MTNRSADDDRYRAVLSANVELHSRMAADYNRLEPHYRFENVSRVGDQLKRLVERTQAKKLLDLGCGTGFMIDLARPLVEEIHGVDITEEMLRRVDRSGPANVTLWCEDTARFSTGEGTFDLVTSYSFLHHLYDIAPTLEAAYRALRPGGLYYAGLEPNAEFWSPLASLDLDGELSATIRTEAEKVQLKDHEVATNLGVEKELLDQAEYGKNVIRGFGAEALSEELHAAGFVTANVSFYWFVGQANVINDPNEEPKERMRLASRVESVLQEALPISRSLFKYLDVVAVK